MEENNAKIPQTKGISIASFILGIIGLIAWILPFLGYPITILGLIFSIVSNKKSKNKYSKIGIILSAIALGLTLLNSIAGVILVLRTMY